MGQAAACFSRRPMLMDNFQAHTRQVAPQAETEATYPKQLLII